MIALDTSAPVAILWQEADADGFSRMISTAKTLIIGMPMLFELRIFMVGRIGPANAELAISELLTGVVRRGDFDRCHLAEAIAALDRFGKGRHPASLNFGHCMAYAVAKVACCPLLNKGDDFARTDFRSALAVSAWAMG